MKRRTSFLSFLAVGAVGIFVGAAACGGASHDSGFDTGTDGGGQFGKDGGFGDSGPCHGIGCNVANCTGKPDTTISGTVYAPNGTLPLYNVIVYVPNDPLGNFTEGVSCDTCGKVSGNPITSTVSNSDGTFQLKGVPNGKNIPLVFQVGKWRRQVTIDNVASCTDNPITDPNLSRLPKNHTEGDIPHIAVTTGDCDKIACVLPKMGIDSSEFGVESDYADKRVIFYDGNHAISDSYTLNNVTTAKDHLWNDSASLKKYDVAIFSCECDEELSDKPTPDPDAVTDYLNSGGRTFGTDFMYTWVQRSAAPEPSVMQNFVGGAPGPVSQTYSVDTSFPKGVALSEWLQAAGASTTAGQIPLEEVYENFDRVDSTLGQRWIYDDVHDDVISFTTPFSEPDESKRCGKSYYLEVHVGPIDSPDTVDSTFPADCKDSFTPQQKALVFFLFDLASCIQSDKGAVNPPR